MFFHYYNHLYSNLYYRAAKYQGHQIKYNIFFLNKYICSDHIDKNPCKISEIYYQKSFCFVLFLPLHIHYTCTHGNSLHKLKASIQTRLFPSFNFLMDTCIILYFLSYVNFIAYWLFISSTNILLSICGFAFPFVSFIACPTKYPIALSLPALKSATD